MFIVALIFAVLGAFLTASIFGQWNRHDYNDQRSFWGRNWLPLIIGLNVGFWAISGCFYWSNVGTIYDMKVERTVHLENAKEFLKTLNAKVLIETDNEKVQINVGNLGQSVKTSEMWSSLVNDILKYNTKVGNFKWYEESPFLCWMTYGSFPDTWRELKYIRINEVQ